MGLDTLQVLAAASWLENGHWSGNKGLGDKNFMHHGDFLDYGLRINEATDEWRLDNILKDLNRLPDTDSCPDCGLLRTAARRKRDGHLVLLPHEERVRLLTVSQKWSTLDIKDGRDKLRCDYQDALCGDGLIATLTERDRKTRDFHALLCTYAGVEVGVQPDEDGLKTLGTALLLVQEASAQWLLGNDSKRRELKNWSSDHTIRTIWKRDLVLN